MRRNATRQLREIVFGQVNSQTFAKRFIGTRHNWTEQKHSQAALVQAEQLAKVKLARKKPRPKPGLNADARFNSPCETFTNDAGNAADACAQKGKAGGLRSRSSWPHNSWYGWDEAGDRCCLIVLKADIP